MTEIAPTRFDDQLGSIGLGNHFAEICEVRNVQNQQEADKLSISVDSVILVVHSGSRSFGKDVFMQTKEKCITENNAEFEVFTQQHDAAVKWAKANRLLIAARVTGYVPDPIIDISHNYVIKDGNRFLHRKGAAATNQGLIILPGSRGTCSYILKPTTISDETAYSLGHGTGRRLSRHQASLKASGKHYRDNSVVIGGTRSVLNEEIPEAYKSVQDVLEDSLPYAAVVAELAPV